MEYPFLEEFNSLNEAGAKYLIVGGQAVILHGVSRFTFDADIIISLDDNNTIKVMDVLTGLGYKTKNSLIDPHDFAKKEIRDGWIEEKHMKAFNFTKSGGGEHKELDIVIEHSLHFETSYKDRSDKNYGPLKVPVLNKDDLILMKVDSGRAKDMKDVELLKKLIEENKAKEKEKENDIGMER
jgi:hypothetical protein